MQLLLSEVELDRAGSGNLAREESMGMDAERIVIAIGNFVEVQSPGPDAILGRVV